MTVAHHGESAVMSVFESCSVPETGIEPAQRCRYQILSLARLPVPPFGLKAGCKDKI